MNIAEVLHLDDRRQRRSEIREQLAEIALKEQRFDELDATIAEHYRVVDAAADEHGRTCEPIQSRLKSLETSILKAMAEREPVHPGDESERAALLTQLEAANEALARETEHCEKLTGPLKKERDRLRVEIAGQNVEDRLADEENGNPDLLDKMHCAGQCLSFAHQRLNFAQIALKRVDDLIEHGRRRGDESYVKSCELRVRRWRLEVAEAQRLLNEAQQEVARIRHCLIDE